MKFLFFFILAIGGICILSGLRKSGHPIKGFAVSAVLGCCSFFAIRFLGTYLPVALPLNIFTAAVSIVGGIPGVIFLVLGQCICSF